MSEYYELLKSSVEKTKKGDEFDVGYSYGMVGFAHSVGLISLEEANSLRKIISER